MIGGPPVLYVRHSALDTVESDDTDRLGEVWSSFRGAKKSLNQGARLEYLSWRLYTRGILQKYRQREEPAEVPLLVDPPGLEMSSSTESIHRGFSSHRVVDLFDRICTYPATPVDSLKVCPQIPRDLGLSGVVEVPPTLPVEEEEEEEDPVDTRASPAIDIQRPAVPEICGFDRVSVNDRSYSSLNQPATARINALSGLGGTGAPRFFIESSSESEGEKEDVPIPTPSRPGLVRRKTVTFEEPSPVLLPTRTPTPTQTESAGEEESEESAGEEDDAVDSSNWGDSDWDDFSEDEETIFAGRVVPKLQQRRSLLSSMFAETSRASTPLEHSAHLVPSPDSEPNALGFQVGSAPYLGRVASQSSLFESAMQNTAVDQIILNNNLQSHIPIAAGSSHSRSASIPHNEVMERELSQSVRSDLSHKRLYDIDMLWRSQRAQTPASQRRPTLGRSTTMPAPRGSSFDNGDMQDSQGYHTRGW